MSQDLLHPLVKRALETYDVIAETIACDPELADTAAFCKQYGYSLEQSANTIIIATRTEPAQFVACLVLASTKLDVNKKVRQLMGIRKLSFASVTQTTELTGMLIGGVTAIGLPTALQLYIDQAVMEQPKLIIGGGNRSSKLIITPGELLKLPKVDVIQQLALAR